MPGYKSALHAAPGAACRDRSVAGILPRPCDAPAPVPADAVAAASKAAAGISSAEASERLLGLLGEAGEATEHGEPCWCCCDNATFTRRMCCPCSCCCSCCSCCRRSCPTCPAVCCWQACRSDSCRGLLQARHAAAAVAAASARCSASAARRRCKCAQCCWNCVTAATRSRNPNSGHSTGVKTSSAERLCQSRKSERRVSPLVRTSRSTGGHPAVYRCRSSPDPQALPSTLALALLGAVATAAAPTAGVPALLPVLPQLVDVAKLSRACSSSSDALQAVTKQENRIALQICKQATCCAHWDAVACPGSRPRAGGGWRLGRSRAKAPTTAGRQRRCARSSHHTGRPGLAVCSSSRV